MKLLLLHGAAKAASRKKLTELKAKFNQNNVLVFEEGSEMENILGSISTPSLFSDEQLIILENPAEDFTFDSLPCRQAGLTLHDSLTLTFWFDHEVGDKKPVMEYVKKNGQVLFFPEGKEVSIFPFLDFLGNKDKRAFLEIENLKKAGFDTQYFITMIFYLLRNLAITPKNAPQFVRDKLQRQRKNFDLEKIKNLYKEILEIDFKIKSGLLEKSQAEFLLINKFTG